ncbi:hypothetical protein [Arsukibacterium sp.]|uniref:hypothetical protein n=1 Tax=Arsukibacterium sp. TaxID=1977258 RepID=UPI002FD90211
MRKAWPLIVVLIVLVVAGWQLYQGRATSLITDPIPGTTIMLDQSDTSAASLTAMPAAEALPKLKQQQAVCQQQQQDFEQQAVTETEQALRGQFRQWLQSGVPLQQLYQQLLNLEDMQPYLQLLFDEASLLQAEQWGIPVVTGSNENIEQLYADILLPTDIFNEQQWQQVLSSIAASSAFHHLAILDMHRHWRYSRALSPGVSFAGSLNEVPLQVAIQLLNGVSLYPMQIANAIDQQVDAELIEQMLLQGTDVTALPIYRMLIDNTRPVFNLADVALLAGRSELLPLLARYQIEPSQLEGVFSAVDYLIYGITLYNREHSRQQQLQQQSSERCNEACPAFTVEQQQLLLQLASDGHRLHSFSDFQDPYLQHGWLMARQLLDDAQFQQSVTDFNPLQTAETLQLSALLTSMDEQNPARQKECVDISVQLASLEQLWSKEQVITILQHYMLEHGQLQQTEQAAGQQMHSQQGQVSDAFLQALSEHEPALVVHFQRQQQWFPTAYLDKSGVKLYLQMIAAWHSNELMQQLVLTTPLSSYLTTELLIWLVHNPSEIEMWQGRPLAQAPHHLQNFRYLEAHSWQALANAGFDLRLTDSLNLTLYQQAFENPESEQLVSLLLDKGVPVQHGRWGPDALHLALDWSYKQTALFPLLAEILDRPLTITASHLSRMQRLKSFYPELYSEIISAHPQLQVAEQQPMNRLLSL